MILPAGGDVFVVSVVSALRCDGDVNDVGFCAPSELVARLYGDVVDDAVVVVAGRRRQDVRVAVQEGRGRRRRQADGDVDPFVLLLVDGTQPQTVFDDAAVADALPDEPVPASFRLQPVAVARRRHPQLRRRCFPCT